MNRSLILVLISLGWAVDIPITSARAASLFVLATTPDMADFARQIGGAHIRVEALSDGKVDLHFFTPRPSHVMKLKKADLLIVSGMDLDLWVQSLIDAARNPDVRFGRSGYVDASDGIVPLDVPQGRIDGSMGDVHAHGNPHYWFTEQNVTRIVENIGRALVRLDPDHRDPYRANQAAYLKQVHETFTRLQTRLKPYQDTSVLQFHKSWDYFCLAFGLHIADQLEPKPGIGPTAAHLQEVLETIRVQHVRLLLAEPYYPRRPIRFVEQNSPVKALRLALYLGGQPGPKTYLENLTYNVDALVKALQETP